MEIDSTTSPGNLLRKFEVQSFFLSLKELHRLIVNPKNKSNKPQEAKLDKSGMLHLP